MDKVRIGTCEACGSDFLVEEDCAADRILVLCSCGNRYFFKDGMSGTKAPGERTLSRGGSGGPSARRAIRVIGSFLYGIILGAVIVSYPSLELGHYESAATSYISFLMAICKLATAVVSVSFFLAGLYWAYRLSADGNSRAIAFGLPLVVFTMTVLPFATTLREYDFTYSNIFLYFLLGVTGSTVVFCSLIIMLVSTDAVIFRLGRILSILPYILFTTLWLTGLGQATILYLSSPRSLWLKLIVGACNLVVALFLLLIPAGAAFFISD